MCVCVCVCVCVYLALSKVIYSEGKVEVKVLNVSIIVLEREKMSGDGRRESL